jgi:hypothetical protein
VTPLEIFLITALTALGGFTAWITRRYISHLESDLFRSRKTAHRGTEIAEKAVTVAEDRA